MYGIKSPAPICADPALGGSARRRRRDDVADCQIVQAPSGAQGTRLVPDLMDKRARPDGPMAKGKFG